jgi:hypothetical protein
MSSKTRTAKRAVQRKKDSEMLGGFPLSDRGLPIATTSREIELECQPVGALLDTAGDNIRDQIDWPETPTYTATFAGGDTETFEYTEESIKDAPDEDKEAWADYILAQDKAQAEYDAKFANTSTRIIATDGVRVLNAPPEDEWIKRQQWQGLDVPDDPLERSLHYFLTVAIGDVEKDMMQIYKGIVLASGRSQEEVEKIEAFFRGEVGDDAGDGDTAEKDQAGNGPGEEKALVGK